MNRKIFVFGLIIGLIISTLFSYTVFAKTKKQSCTITIKVYEMSSCWDNYRAAYTNNTSDTSEKEGWKCFTQAIGMDDKYLDSKKKIKWYQLFEYISPVSREYEKYLEAGKYAFAFNQKDVKSNPSVSGGYGEFSSKLTHSEVVKTHKFTFSDNKNVQLVMAAYDSSGKSKGSIMGALTYDDNEVDEMQRYKSVDWYRRTSNTKAYKSGNLTITQNADSSTLEITNVGTKKEASNITINVYISKTPIGIDLSDAKDVSQTTVNGDGLLKGSNDSNSKKRR